MNEEAQPEEVKVADVTESLLWTEEEEGMDGWIKISSTLPPTEPGRQAQEKSRPDGSHIRDRYVGTFDGVDHYVRI